MASVQYNMRAAIAAEVGDWYEAEGKLLHVGRSQGVKHALTNIHNRAEGLQSMVSSALAFAHPGCMQLCRLYCCCSQVVRFSHACDHAWCDGRRNGVAWLLTRHSFVYTTGRARWLDSEWYLVGVRTSLRCYGTIAGNQGCSWIS